MSRTTASHPKHLSRDTQRLVKLAESLALSGSRLEDVYWEHLLGTHLSKLLQGKKNQAVENALDYLLTNNINAYEILIEQAESNSESTSLSVHGQDYDVLLFAAPAVVWTRYQLPREYSLRPHIAKIAAQLQDHILAPDAKLALLGELVCFDQMPQTFHDAWAWTHRLGLAALEQKSEPCEIRVPVDNEDMLADARFVVGAIAVRKGGPLFRWQDDTTANTAATRTQCLENWTQACASILTPLFTGCTVEYLLPDAYYVNSREADKHIRPLALKAAVTWLQTVAHLPGDKLRATIAACGEKTLEEYRVGFSTQHSNEVIYGSIWPILSKEESVADSINAEQADIPDEIAALLHELGVVDVRRLSGLYGTDVCDDCGAPYFPNPQGEMLHPELPEEIDLDPVHLH
ncbi:MAG: DUF2863 family protein [Pusillimonas sp.]|nr:MAG: DUF2863 family protein [Pusillimonas sp.]